MHATRGLVILVLANFARRNNDAMCADAASSPPLAPALAREERQRVAGVDVTLSWPSPSADDAAPPAGVTFLLPGANVKISEYDGLRDVILGRRHLVVSLYVNVLWPLFNNHRKHAGDVKKVFDALLALHPDLPNRYSVVGHSLGGKIALLLVSVVDPRRVSAVLALDPVDLNPTEFSNERGSNLPLDDGACKDTAGAMGPLGMFSGDGPDDVVHVVNRGGDYAGGGCERRTPIVLTCTDGGRGIPAKHNAEAIHALHPMTRYHRHAHAGHFAYCDHGGGFARLLVPDVGTEDGNAKARDAAHDLIREILA